MNRSVLVQSGRARYAQDIAIGGHALRADEPLEAGGGDTGPAPYELLLSALGACTGITLRMYADRHQWPLEDVRIQLSQGSVHANDCATCDTAPRTMGPVEVEIRFIGALSEEQRQRLFKIAVQCPVHRALTSQLQIHTRLADTGALPEEVSADVSVERGA